MSRGTDPLVSVCIANFQGAGLLRDCLDSIVRQAPGSDVEIIVHDDASTDASLDILRGEYPQVRVIESSRNVGFCTANNRMADVARGHYLLLLNNDAALAPDAIASLLAAAAARRRPAILTLPQFDWDTGDLVDRGCYLDALHVPVPNTADGAPDVAYAIGACLWIPRATWRELGGFPDWMESVGEDLYLCLRARLLGIPVAPLNGSGYRHRQGESFGGNRLRDGRLSTRYRRRLLSERNRIAVLVVCTPTIAMWPWLAFHVACLLVEAGVLCIARASLDPWRKIYGAALGQSFRRLGQLLATRRDVQRSRTIGLLPYLGCFRIQSRKLKMAMRHGLPLLKP